MTERVIDINCDWAPTAYVERALRIGRGPLRGLERMAAFASLSDVDVRLRALDGFTGYQQVPGLAGPPIDQLAEPEHSPDLARCANDAAAELVAEHPDAFPSFQAVLPQNHPKAMLHEAQRAIESLGAAGVGLQSAGEGRNLVGPAMLELYGLLAELDRPIWLRPARAARPGDPPDTPARADRWWALGAPYEISAACYRLVAAGITERWPYLQFIVPHGGGLLPMVAGRLAPGVGPSSQRTSADWDAAPVNAPSLAQFRRFFADTATLGSSAAIGCALAFWGPERLLFATAAPLDADDQPGWLRTAYSALLDLELDDLDRTAILWRNAARLLHLR